MRIKTNDEYNAMLLRNNYEEIKEEIALNAVLKIVYFDKKSNQTINVKMNHQLNSMEATIHQINPKFQEKSKNYDKIREEMVQVLDSYEDALKQFANKYDEKLKEMLFQKVELESKLLMAVLLGVIKSEEYKENRKYIFKLEKKIKQLNKKIENLDSEKANKIFEAMEIGGRELTVNLKKPRKITKITKFFSNRFNTYNVIMKSVIAPLNQRIDEFKVNELKKVDGEVKEIDLNNIQDRIKSIQNAVLEDSQNKLICKEIGVLKSE